MIPIKNEKSKALPKVNPILKLMSNHYSNP